MTMTARQLEILQHALGVDRYGRNPRGANLAYGGFCRNWFCAGTSDELECRDLVAMGYMREHATTSLYPYYNVSVTAEGIKAMREASPNPPKRTRSQLRFEEFRNAQDAFGCTFREFLDMQKKDWYKRLKAGLSV